MAAHLNSVAFPTVAASLKCRALAGQCSAYRACKWSPNTHTHALKDWDLIYVLFIFTIYISCYILILQRHAKCCFTVVTEFEVRFLNNRTLWVQRQSWPCINSHSLMAHCNCNKWPWNPQYFTLHMCPFDAGKWQTYCDNYVNVVSLQLVAG